MQAERCCRHHRSLRRRHDHGPTRTQTHEHGNSRGRDPLVSLVMTNVLQSTCSFVQCSC